MGKGFGLVGGEKELEVGKRDLFGEVIVYWIGLEGYIVIELKGSGLKGEYGGEVKF